MQCVRCPYQTGCQRAMITHAAACPGCMVGQPNAGDLPQEYHCVCGFSANGGNALAAHLVSCGRQSAYESAEVAATNIVHRNMLDMLDLVRRGDDAETEDGEEGADGGNDAEAETEAQPDETAAATETAVADTSAEDAGVSAEDHHFNTELSLDDLAAPASVAPMSSMLQSAMPEPEPDRTPQLSDEYLSLATPRIAAPMEHGGSSGEQL